MIGYHTGNRSIGLWIRKSRMAFIVLFSAVLAIAAISSCRKEPPAAKNTAQQQASVAQALPQSTQQTSVAKLEPAHVPTKDEQSCQEFVQKFYDWYVFNMHDGWCKQSHDAESCKEASDFHSVPAMSLKHVQSPSLTRLLDKFKAAQGEDDPGLDFDYYLNTQDGSGKFEVESVQVKNNQCNAVVNGIAGGQKRERVLPELVKTDGKWLFVNFYYKFDMGDGKPVDDDDLVHMLKEYIGEEKFTGK
jgi:Protein of unknown function (DUF3828)